MSSNRFSESLKRCVLSAIDVPRFAEEVFHAHAWEAMVFLKPSSTGRTAPEWHGLGGLMT